MMRKLFFLLTFLPSITYAAISTPLSQLNPMIYPPTMKSEYVYSIIKNNDFHNWSILISKNYASLNWNKDSSSSLVLYITPSQNRINLDIVAKKNKYNESKLTYITWNIKKVSITLNKTEDTHDWVTYSTTIYTENIEKFIKALQNNSPMILNLSILHSIPIGMDGLQPALTTFMNIIKEKKLKAPPFLSAQDSNLEASTPPDGMSPHLFSLFNQADYYVQKCINLSSKPLNDPGRKQTCTTRNDYLDKMKDKGWCWGSDDPDQHDKNKNWKPCIMNPKGIVPKLKKTIREDLEKAQSIMKQE